MPIPSRRPIDRSDAPLAPAPVAPADGVVQRSGRVDTRGGQVVIRIWRGWTTQEQADAYEQLLRAEIIPGIEARAVPGFLGITLARRPLGAETEFVTLMRFTSLDAVRSFAGEDYGSAYVPDAARRILARFEERSSHYEVVEDRPAPSRGPTG
jgi:heme-degrading monooxygenase HmoA